jgi:predicted RNase H-like HicB family nuclease
MNKYLIIIEKTQTGYSGYSPDVPGCVSVGGSKKECELNMREALKYHIEFMIEKGYEIPKPTSRVAEFISIRLPQNQLTLSSA